MDPSTCPGGAPACLGSEPGIFAGEATIRVPGKWAIAARCCIRVPYAPGTELPGAGMGSVCPWRQLKVWKHYFAATLFNFYVRLPYGVCFLFLCVKNPSVLP